MTKLTWDNAAMVSPKTSENLGLTHKVAARGGEHGQITSPLIDIALSNSKVTAAAWTLPGQADGVVVLPLGYGRMFAGYSGTNKGFNANAVRVSTALWVASGGKITKTGDEYPLACTQYHFNMEGRKILSAGTLEEYKKNPAFAHEGDETPPKEDSLYKEFAYPGYAWGMAIDLKNCNGCNACVVACGSENNIAIVGKDQVMRGREMHWIRVDRYYMAETSTNDPTTNENDALANPETYFQPVPCQQCENAPCEQVCPVGATVHSSEGLNDMVYNRCVGTRYCSNNCPYKVRRFNFLRFQDWETPSLKLQRNPEVTVRSRGVMEKCTYCVQRINNARIESEKKNRPIADGDIVTACEAACPSEAIVFGNANDPNSRVAKLKAQQRNYSILGELNARPRTTYLAVGAQSESGDGKGMSATQPPVNSPEIRRLPPVLEPGHSYATVTDKIASIVLTRPVSLGWLAGFGLAFSVVMILNVAVGWLIIKGVGIWAHQHPDRLGLRDRQLRLVDRYRSRRHADLGDFVFAEPEVAHVDQPLCRSDDAVRGRLRGLVSADPHRASVDGVLHVPVPEHDGDLAAIPQPADLGRVRGFDLRHGFGCCSGSSA